MKRTTILTLGLVLAVIPACTTGGRAVPAPRVAGDTGLAIRAASVRLADAVNQLPATNHVQVFPIMYQKGYAAVGIIEFVRPGDEADWGRPTELEARRVLLVFASDPTYGGHLAVYEHRHVATDGADGPAPWIAPVLLRWNRNDVADAPNCLQELAGASDCYFQLLGEAAGGAA